MILASLAFAAAPGPLEREFQLAAAEHEVPVEVLFAIGWEASHLNPVAASTWGGQGMFDFMEADETGGPSLEVASALIETNPNLVARSWPLQVRGAAALLADYARGHNGGELPSRTDLDAWQSAVSAFSGREEPGHQAMYVKYVYELLQDGFVADTPMGEIVVEPQLVNPERSAPPPASGDSSVGDQFVAAASCNYSDYSRGSGDIDMVIIHTVQGSYSGCYSWFQNCDAGASAHYVVRSSDGAITQMVWEADVGWHAGNWDYNLRSVGIEHEGYVDDCSYYTDAMYRESAALTADIASRQGVPLDRSHIIGHNEVPDPDGSGYGGSGHHTDPGDCWDWDYYMSLVGGETSDPTGEIVGFVRDSDIYNESGNLVGATVWIAETGDTTTVDASGFYEFPGLPYGNYTIHADIDGYLEGTCASALSSSQDWCSIALFPGDDDTDDTDTDVPTDTGAPDGDSAADTEGPGDDDGSADDLLTPGKPVMMDEVEAGCGCSNAGSVAGAASLAATLLLVRRRR